MGKNTDKIYNTSLSLNFNDSWKYFKLTKLFKFYRGQRLVKSDRKLGEIPFVTAGKENYGIKEYINSNGLGQEIYSNAITIDMFCNVFYHSDNFSCDDNIFVLQAHEHYLLSKYVLIFICAVISEDSYRYDFGRQYRQKHLVKHKIKLPVDKQGNPDWQLMENYIKSLPYSSNL